MTAKLVTIKTVTPGTDVFIYNPNPTTTTAAYPKLLPSTSANGVNTFKTSNSQDLWIGVLGDLLIAS